MAGTASQTAASFSMSHGSSSLFSYSPWRVNVHFAIRQRSAARVFNLDIFNRVTTSTKLSGWYPKSSFSRLLSVLVTVLRALRSFGRRATPTFQADAYMTLTARFTAASAPMQPACPGANQAHSISHELQPESSHQSCELPAAGLHFAAPSHARY